MSQNLGTLTITPGTNTIFGAPDGGARAVVIGNESGVTCIIAMEGGSVQKTLYPGTVDWFEIKNGFTGNIKINPTAYLLNGSSFPVNTLFFDAIGPNDPEQAYMYPVTLPTRQTVTATATGNPIFSATIGFGVTASIHQTLNIFNPATSGKTLTFHSARVFTSSSNVGNLGFLTLKSGVDLNLGTPVSAVSHDGNASPRVSVANCTAEDSITGHGGTDIEGLDTLSNVTGDFLTFPDVVTLAPGNNLRLVMVDALNYGHAVRLTMKWSEA